MKLKGLTWDHPRGYAPLIAGAREYRQSHPNVEVSWDRRTLREFGEAPIEQYANRYDLIVIDHPFVGYAAAHDVLVNLAPFVTPAERQGFASDSAGPSWYSYWYAGGLWALPIDAATQVASYRPDLLSKFSIAPPKTFDEVLKLAAKAQTQRQFVIVPAWPTDAISLVFTLSANIGHPIPETTDTFLETGVAREVLDRLHALIASAHPKSVDWNPIQVYDFMVSTNEGVYCPWGFGYSNYSRRGVPVSLQFFDAPATGNMGCGGTMIGGTGVAVTASCAHRAEAVAYAKWLATIEHQCGTYFREGGQPASLAAWTDPANDTEAYGFFSRTLTTLQSAYVRPRFDGFVRFFESAGIEINRCLRGDLSDQKLIGWLNAHFAARRAMAKKV
ncbi:MAG: ABC transporter substrate-binding protein [Candidatus Acidiferrales bacterium]